MIYKLFSLLIILALAPTVLAQMSVHSGWARETPPGGTVSAAYLTINNKSPHADKLLGISSDIGTVELHDSVLTDGMMEMVHLKDIQIPANSEVSLKPSGKHIMLFQLKKPLIAGETLTLTLNFKNSGKLQTKISIKKL